MTDIEVDDPVDVAKEPQRILDLRPFIRRWRAAEVERVRLGELVALNVLEVSASRQELDDALAKVLDVLDVKGDL